MSEKRPPKRQRGGQPGNSNARKHGMYAANLLPEHVADYWKHRKEGMSHEQAMFQAKLMQALRNAPGNNRVFRELGDTLAKFMIRDAQLTGPAADAVRMIARETVKAAQDQALNGTRFETSRANVALAALLEDLEEE